MTDDLAVWAVTAADPLADAVVAAIAEDGPDVAQALRQGIADGLASLTDPPPSVAALLGSTETIPAGLDDLLDAGAWAAFSAPVAAHVIALSAGALVRVYSSPSIAVVLAHTGEMIDVAARRIEETGTWIANTTLPGALRPGRLGYIATLQVRMLHAHIRALAAEHTDIVPINQADLARTWIDFTLTMFGAEARMGFDRTPAELAELYRYWRHIGDLLGVDARLIGAVDSDDAARRLDQLLATVTGDPIPASSALAMAALESIAVRLRELVPLPPAIGRRFLFALARRFHGPALADRLGIPRAPVASAALVPAVAVIRAVGSLRRRSPRRWRTLHDRNLAATRQLLAEQPPGTAYQRV